MELHEKLFYESELKGVEIMLEALDQESVLWRACDQYKKYLNYLLEKEEE